MRSNRWSAGGRKTNGTRPAAPGESSLRPSVCPYRRSGRAIFNHHTRENWAINPASSSDTDDDHDPRLAATSANQQEPRPPIGPRSSKSMSLLFEQRTSGIGVVESVSIEEKYKYPTPEHITKLI